MRRRRLQLVVFVTAALTPATSRAEDGKEAIRQSVERRAAAAWKLSEDIRGWAEPGYKEVKSSAALIAYLEKDGFTIERGVAGIPTAFTATFGAGKPVVAVLGEYDALPELAQEVVPFRKTPEGGTGYGHGCGHHLFGVASATACLVLADQLRAGKVKGTVRFYGCPAEEGGSAKAFMVRDGLFADCDVCLHWHPAGGNLAGDYATTARAAAKFRFHGTAAHAAEPDKGRSALDALLLTIHAAELLREHTPDGTRLHHTVTSGGGSPNVVPDFAEGFFYVRHPRAEEVARVYARLLKCAQAGALATETRLEVEYLGGSAERVPNRPLAEAARANLAAMNDLRYDPEERRFALRLQETFADRRPLEDVSKVFGVPKDTTTPASTDVGDVSWVVPTVGFQAACFVPGTPSHSWQAVACGGTTIARKGMLLAAKVLAANAWDLYQDPALLAAAKAEHRRQLDGRAFFPLVGKKSVPPLNYRDPPKRTPGE